MPRAAAVHRGAEWYESRVKAVLEDNDALGTPDGYSYTFFAAPQVATCAAFPLPDSLAFKGDIVVDDAQRARESGRAAAF